MNISKKSCLEKSYCEISTTNIPLIGDIPKKSLERFKKKIASRSDDPIPPNVLSQGGDALFFALAAKSKIMQKEVYELFSASGFMENAKRLHETNKNNWIKLINNAPLDTEQDKALAKDIEINLKKNGETYKEKILPRLLQLKDDSGNYIPDIFIISKRCYTTTGKGQCREKHGVAKSSSCYTSGIASGRNYDSKGCVTPCSYSSGTSMCSIWKCCDIRIDSPTLKKAPLSKRDSLRNQKDNNLKKINKLEKQLRNGDFKVVEEVKNIKAKISDLRNHHKLLVKDYDISMAKEIKKVYCGCCQKYSTETFGYNLIEIQRQLSVINCEISKNKIGSQKVIDNMTSDEIKIRAEKLGVSEEDYKNSISNNTIILYNPVTQRPFLLGEIEEFQRLFTKQMNAYNKTLTRKIFDQVEWGISKVSTSIQLAVVAGYVMGFPLVSTSTVAYIAYVVANVAFVKLWYKINDLYRDNPSPTTGDYIHLAVDSLISFAIANRAAQAAGCDALCSSQVGKVLELIHPNIDSNSFYYTYFEKFKTIVAKSYFLAGGETIRSLIGSDYKGIELIKKLNSQGLLSFTLTSNSILALQVKLLDERTNEKTSFFSNSFSLQLNEMIHISEAARVQKIRLDYSPELMESGQGDANKIINLLKSCEINALDVIENGPDKYDNLNIKNNEESPISEQDEELVDDIIKLGHKIDEDYKSNINQVKKDVNLYKAPEPKCPPHEYWDINTNRCAAEKCSAQGAGGSGGLYNHIINRETGREVNINSKLGKQIYNILKTYTLV